MSGLIIIAAFLPVLLVAASTHLFDMTRREALVVGTVLMLLSTGAALYWGGGFDWLRWHMRAASTPEDQRSFLALVAGAPADDAAVAPGVAAFCARGAGAQGWRGRVHKLLFALSGRAAMLTVQVGPDVYVGTRDNVAASQLVDADAPGFAAVTTLQAGQDIWISGRFARDGAGCVARYEDKGKSTGWYFVFDFSAIATAPAGPGAGS